MTLKLNYFQKQEDTMAEKHQYPTVILKGQLTIFLPRGEQIVVKGVKKKCKVTFYAKKDAAVISAEEGVVRCVNGQPGIGLKDLIATVRKYVIYDKGKHLGRDKIARIIDGASLSGDIVVIYDTDHYNKRLHFSKKGARKWIEEKRKKHPMYAAIFKN